jgi:uncharacterized protein YjiS (DUF1127 family)
MVHSEDAMFDLLAQVLDDLARGRRRQAAIRELDKLSDHLLADVGLRREQLPTLTLELTDEKERDRALALVFQPELQPCG